MNRRQMIGWLSIAVGIVLIILAVHSMHEFAKNQAMSTHVKHFFTNNPMWNCIIKWFGGKPQVKVPEHDVPAVITEIIGIVLVAAGGVFVYVSRKNKRT
jgi:hypothetical protein